MKRLLHEPLVHFLALGALIFAAYAVVNRHAPASQGTILVTRGRIEAMEAAFARTQQRPPTKDETTALIDGYVREEASVREAMALGLDRDDAVIRRRLQEKLDFVTADAEPREPGDAELAAYLAAHPEQFRGETRFTFKQVYFDRGKRGVDTVQDATAALASLVANGRSSSLGDQFLLDDEFRSVASSDIAMRFGDAFAQALEKVPEGQWAGPIASAYGEHLVLLTQRKTGVVPTLDEARAAVKREWQNARRDEARKNSEHNLVGRYKVTIER